METSKPRSEMKWQPWEGSELPTLRTRESDSPEARKENSKAVANRFVIAIALALLTTALQYCAVNSLSGSSAGESGTILRVATMTRDVAAGEILIPESVEYQEVSGERCLQSLIAQGDEDLLTRRMSAVPVMAGEPIFKSAALVPTTRRSLISQVPAGKQLYSLPVTDARLAQALRAGDRIDVVGNLNLPEKGFVTRTLLMGVIVAGVENSGGEFSVFLFLEKADTEFLTHAKRFGDFVVVPRNAKDTSVAGNIEGMTQTRFLNDARIRQVYENDLFQIQNGEATRASE